VRVGSGGRIAATPVPVEVNANARSHKTTLDAEVRVIEDEFKKTKTLQDKNLLTAMIFQPYDDSFTEWSTANKITLPAENTLRTVAAKHLYSD